MSKDVSTGQWQLEVRLKAVLQARWCLHTLNSHAPPQSLNSTLPSHWFVFLFSLARSPCHSPTQPEMASRRDGCSLAVVSRGVVQVNQANQAYQAYQAVHETHSWPMLLVSMLRAATPSPLPGSSSYSSQFLSRAYLVSENAHIAHSTPHLLLVPSIRAPSLRALMCLVRLSRLAEEEKAAHTTL